MDQQNTWWWRCKSKTDLAGQESLKCNTKNFFNPGHFEPPFVIYNLLFWQNKWLKPKICKNPLFEAPHPHPPSKKNASQCQKNRLRVGCRLWKIYFKLANGLFLRENLNFKAPCRNFTWNFLLWKGKVVARQIINNDDITDYGDSWIKGQHEVASIWYWRIMKKPQTSSFRSECSIAEFEFFLLLFLTSEIFSESASHFNNGISICEYWSSQQQPFGV